MKILHTAGGYYPSVGGVQEVVKQLSERLVKLDHEVTVIAQKNESRKEDKINGVNIQEFDIRGNFFEGYSGEVKEYQSFLKNSKFDIITNFAAQHWPTDLLLPIMQEIKAKKVFVPTGFSGLYLPEYHGYYERMKCWMKQFDMNIFLSYNYRDINFARENKIENLVVIPNGAAMDEFYPGPGIKIRKKLKIPPDNFILLLVGSHTNLKGHKEAIKIFKRAKIRHSTLIIVGNTYVKRCYFTCRINEFLVNLNILNILYSKSMIVKEFSRPDTIALYKNANLFLFPSNIECSPLVLFECMAAKLPFLTTDVGNSKEIIEWSHGGELMPTKFDENGYSHANIKESTKILEGLYNDQNFLQNLAENGYNSWQNNFTWEIIAQKYEQLYLHLVDQK